MTATQTTSSPANRVWTVRAGVTGQGMDLFHVYAPTMDSAREAAKRTAKETPLVDKLTWNGFTVHAGVPVAGLTLREAPVAVILPALDVPTLDLVDADDIIPSAATHTFV